MSGRAIAGLIGFSLLYWMLALGFSLGAMLGGCEPSAAGCSQITPAMVLGTAFALYAAIIVAGIALERRRRR